MIDLHCHLDLYPDPIKVLDEVVSSGMFVLAVTTTPSAFSGDVARFGGASRVRVAIGLHPELAHSRMSELPLLEHYISLTSYVGEVGLDGSPDFARFSKEQRKAFDLALRSSALRGGRLISIHSRGAAAEVLESLEAHPEAGVPILHWFSGRVSDLKRAIDRGCWFSFGPAAFRSASTRSMVARIPRSRVLTETDGPFAMNRDVPLRPTDVALAEAALAKIWSAPASEVRSQLVENFRDLVGNVKSGHAHDKSGRSYFDH